MGGGEARRDMGFHIHRHRASGHMQRPLMRRIGDRGIDTGYIDDQRAAKRSGESLRPRSVAFEILPVFGDDGPRDQRCSGAQAGCETTRYAETDDRRHIRMQRFFELGEKARAIATARNDGDMRSGRDARLGNQAGDGENRAGLYMPTCRPGWLLRVRFLKRASAQSGKNFE